MVLKDMSRAPTAGGERRHSFRALQNIGLEWAGAGGVAGQDGIAVAAERIDMGHIAEHGSAEGVDRTLAGNRKRAQSCAVA
jgi:hypothetical protein